ncbi:MAG TPA: serine hydrolase domain-containing protein, partial [Azospirillaceae bacterium]|nr:serine hydrolase domain-containing protein [Azospirillaceae bacterium]
MSGYVSRRGLLLSGGAAGLSLGFAGAARAQGADPLAGIEALVHDFLREFGTPGVGLAVVRKGQRDWYGTYGQRELKRRDRVDADTLFAVASNTKSMTAAGLAILVDEGKLAWDDPVTKHLPDFAMYDEVTTRLMTVRDLLTHRSGLPLGAGDLMIWPTTTHTRD